VDIQTIQRAIDALPRHRLTNLPTPLQACPRLSAELGGPRIWIKRDDMTGLAFGGNKSRYLEFTLAEATAQGCDAAVLSAVVQSNHCRQFAAACARLGLKGVVVLRENETTMGRRDPAQGNYLIDQLCGVDIRFALPEEIGATVEAEKARLASEGYTPFTGLSGLLSRIGYIQCALEMENQCLAEGIEPGHLVVGSGGTSLAGLVAGFTMLGRALHFLGTPQSKMGQADGVSERIAQSAADAAAHIGLECIADPARIAVTDAYVGTGFGYPDPQTLDAIRLLAGNEGILVDPTYSGKAFACLVDQLQKGRFATSEDIIFVHTGGTPLLFAYGEELLA
jgi:1-aminocyclopropane-1-carboxylate deaminase/D-cysteine desulfhydrase-like pyridoxal-dependent ACC family enzyme